MKKILLAVILLIFIPNVSSAQYFFPLGDFELYTWKEDVYLKEDGSADFELTLTFDYFPVNSSFIIYSTPVMIGDYNFTNFQVHIPGINKSDIDLDVKNSDSFNNVRARIRVKTSDILDLSDPIFVYINYSASFYGYCNEHYECKFLNGEFWGREIKYFEKNVHLPPGYEPSLYDT